MMNILLICRGPHCSFRVPNKEFQPYLNNIYYDIIFLRLLFFYLFFSLFLDRQHTQDPRVRMVSNKILLRNQVWAGSRIKLHIFNCGSHCLCFDDLWCCKGWYYYKDFCFLVSSRTELQN